MSALQDVKNSMLPDAILHKIGEKGKELTRAEVEDFINQTVSLGVSSDEAARAALAYFRKKCGISTAAQDSTIDALSDGFVNLRVKVLDLWENNNPRIAQVGLIGDETGATKFTMWSAKTVVLLEIGKSYSIKNAKVDTYQGECSIVIGNKCVIEPLNEDIQVGANLKDFAGTVVTVHPSSGLVKVCKECGYVLEKSVCKQHGKTKGADDLYLRANLDNGEKVFTIKGGFKAVSELTGLDVKSAKELQEETGSPEAVTDRIKEALLGKQVVCHAAKYGRTLRAESINTVTAPAASEIEEVLSRV